MSMALSFCTNWLNQDTCYTSLFRPPSPELPPELFAFHEDSTLYDTCMNPLFDPIYNHLEYFPSLSPATYSDTPPPITPTGNVFTQEPELQVSSYTHEDPYYNLPYSAAFMPGLCEKGRFFTVASSELPPLPENYQRGGCAAPATSWHDSRAQVKKQSNGNGGGSLSAQSMAARVRRRKISEKTWELGKLIPGGHKMNTAEMFQAAFKYIKFLQAQVGVLKLMASLPENEEVLGNGEMQALVTCTLTQEKLYTAEKCIAPKQFAETLAKDH